MFKHKPSNLTFDNRKQALLVMGKKRYNRALSNREFDFQASPDVDNSTEITNNIINLEG